MKLTREEVKHIATLAKLDLTDAELDKYSVEISAILDYISQLNEVDTSSVTEASHLYDFDGQVLAEDNPQPGLPADKITLNATSGRSEASSFKTSKIVGGEE